MVVFMRVLRRPIDRWRAKDAAALFAASGFQTGRISKESTPFLHPSIAAPETREKKTPENKRGETDIFANKRAV